jgi:hypothetical protein
MLLEVLALICFGIAFFRKNEWMWALALIILGILVFASYNIEQNVSVVNNQTMVGTTIYYHSSIMTQQVVDTTYSYFNIGLFVVALILFLNDLFMNWKNGKSGVRGNV